PLHAAVRRRILGQLPLPERLPVLADHPGLRLPEPVELRRRLLRRAAQEQSLGQRRPAELPPRQGGQGRPREDLRHAGHLQRPELGSGHQLQYELRLGVQDGDRRARPARVHARRATRVLTKSEVVSRKSVVESRKSKVHSQARAPHRRPGLFFGSLDYAFRLSLSPWAFTKGETTSISASA